MLGQQPGRHLHRLVGPDGDRLAGHDLGHRPVGERLGDLDRRLRPGLQVTLGDHPDAGRPVVRPWCGQCASDTFRWLEDPVTHDPLRPCPQCSPQAHAAGTAG